MDESSLCCSLRGWLVVALFAAAPAGAWAQPQRTALAVVVLDSGELPGFVPALQIQLAGVFDVVSREANASALHVSDIVARVRQEPLAGACWLVREGDQVSLHVVGAEGDHAVVRMLASDDRADFERALALRAAALLEAEQVDARSSDPSELPSDDAPVGADPAATTETSWAARAGVEITLSGATGTVPFRPGLRLAAGVSATLSNLKWAFVFGVEGVLPYEHSQADTTLGRAESAELRSPLSLSGLLRVDPVWLGLALRAQLRAAFSEGETGGGTIGTGTHVVPEVGAAALLEWPLTAVVAFHIDAGFVLSLVEQRLLINDRLGASFGRIRFRAAVGLVFDVGL